MSGGMAPKVGYVISHTTKKNHIKFQQNLSNSL
jgi:hypothetical protein